jgi:hypothetical protein
MEKNWQDMNEIAFGIVQQATNSQEPPNKALISKIMAEMGRKGGLKGGKARADSLTPQKRSQIAKKAAKKRWEEHKTDH